jgi:hypothetical protein
MRTIGIAIFASILAALGTTCTLFPGKVQAFAIEFYERHPDLNRANPFASLIRSPSMRIQYRLVGVIALLMAVLLTLALMFAKPIVQQP